MLRPPPAACGSGVFGLQATRARLVMTVEQRARLSRFIDSPRRGRIGNVAQFALEQVLHAVTLFAQLGFAEIHALAAEFIHGQSLHDGVLAILRGDRVRIDQPFLEAEAASEGTAMLTQSPSAV